MLWCVVAQPCVILNLWGTLRNRNSWLKYISKHPIWGPRNSLRMNRNSWLKSIELLGNTMVFPQKLAPFLYQQPIFPPGASRSSGAPSGHRGRAGGRAGAHGGSRGGRGGGRGGGGSGGWRKISGLTRGGAVDLAGDLMIWWDSVDGGVVTFGRTIPDLGPILQRLCTVSGHVQGVQLCFIFLLHTADHQSDSPFKMPGKSTVWLIWWVLAS